MMIVPIMDSARFIGGIIASVTDSTQYRSEDSIYLAAGIAHALRSPVLDHATSSAFDWLGSLSPAVRGLIDLGTFLYAALFAVEGVGLWLGKRWAEWLTVVTTSLLIPIEIYEIVHKPTWERVVVWIMSAGLWLEAKADAHALAQRREKTTDQAERG